jgi:hypothetical protein
MILGRNVKTYNGVTLDRIYRVGETLDLDISKGSAPESVISTFQFVKLCGLKFEQTHCSVLTGDAYFSPVA